MAAEATRGLTAVRRARRVLAWAALALGAAVLILAGALWIGSSLPRNPSWREPAAGVPIMIETNGVHTAIVMPLVTPQKDWRRDVPWTAIKRRDRPYTHVSVSWGERAVFLDTPTWADLSVRDAIRAATGGEPLLHFALYVRPAPSRTARVLRLRPAEYARLVAAIEAHERAPDRRASFAGYDDYDAFTAARGRYDLRHTCNQWTSDMLAAAGVRIGRITPFAGGVMKWIPTPQN